VADRERERWDEWVRRMRDDPESPVSQLTQEGVSLDTALIVTMLGKIQEELVSLVDAGEEGSEWKQDQDDE
jgi:hypothetical protein